MPFALDEQLGSVSKDDGAQPVPLRLEEPLPIFGDLRRDLRQHGRQRRIDRQVHRLSSLASFEDRRSRAPESSANRSFSYDTKLFLVDETHPETGRIEYEYSPAGHRTAQRKGGERVVYDYDRAGRLIGVDPAGTAHDLDFGWDDAGHRLDAESRDARIQSTFDSSGRVVTRDTTISGTRYDVDWVWDGFDRLSEQVYPSGRRVGYHYNSKGQVTRVSDSTGADWISQASYHTSGQLEAVTLGNGASTSIGFDNRFRPTSWLLGTGHFLDLTYDATNNVIAWADNTLTRDLDYDDLDRLTAATGPDGEQITYAYSSTGNRTQRRVDGALESYTYSSHRLNRRNSPSGQISYTYDTAGRTKTQTRPGGVSFSYTWSPLDTQLTATRQEPGTTETLTYRYDADQRRATRTTATKRSSTYAIQRVVSWPNTPVAVRSRPSTCT